MSHAIGDERSGMALTFGIDDRVGALPRIVSGKTAPIARPRGLSGPADGSSERD